MATVVQGNAAAPQLQGQTFFSITFGATPTSGNLLVLKYGARDNNDSGTPTFTMPSGWTKVAEASPMEFHTVGIAWKISDGTSEGTITVTPGSAVRSSWIGVVEYNQSGVTDWELDQFSANGSGATNVSSIASGSTGTLGASVGVAAIVGTSRTGSEGLSTDTGTSLAATDADFETDAGAINCIAAWLSLTATTALDATISESTGSSRMGAAIATFIEAGGAGTPEGTATASMALGASGQGSVEYAGAASASLALAATAQGFVEYAGTASAALALTASATGEFVTFDPANLVAVVDGSDVTLTWDV